MSTQAILNLKQELDSLMFDEKKDFAVHVNKFVAICDEISSYGEEKIKISRRNLFVHYRRLFLL